MFFYDTCALLNLQERAFEEPFVISRVTLRELEEIKTSGKKDEETKYKARNLARLFWSQGEMATAIIRPDCNENEPNDMLILLDYLYACEDLDLHGESLSFVTDDLNLGVLAIAQGVECVMQSAEVTGDTKEYTGWSYFEGSNEELATFYEDLTVNTLGLGINEYVFIPEIGGGMSGYRWTGEQYELLYSKSLSTQQFGSDFRARDIKQRAAIDSIMHNQVTCISGPAGSGKSLLSLVCAFNLLERGLYDRIIMLVNPAKAYGAVDMGFYPGTVYDKLSESFVGHMLETKLGDQFEIDRLLDCNKLQLISMADMRGMEIREREILYITECQNTSVELLKLCLTRVGDGAKVIIEGDFKSQVDSRAFAGSRNGMKRVIDVLKGSSLFGYIRLDQIWRGELAQLIESM